MKAHRPRRTAVGAAAAALVLPLTISAVPASAAALAPSLSAAARAVPVDAYGLPFGGGYVDPYSGVYGGGYGTPWADPYGGSSSGATTAATNTSEATAAQSRGLVLISTVLNFGEGEAAGTGIVVSSDGLVVTNHHVVAGSTSIEVTDATTGKTYTARVVGTDAKRDVAVLRLVGASGLATADLDASGVAVGEAVTAVGDAGGDAGSLTAAPGTVTRLARSITVQGDDGTTSHLHRLIQVSSDIIPGDSGGALLDSEGDVVGMNVAASEGSGPTAGFVIPIARVESVLSTVLAGDDSGAVELGYDAFLGVSLTSGGVVAGVLRGGPAADAGIAAGSTITAVDGAAVASSAQVRRAVTSQQPGDTVTVTWTGIAGRTHSASVTLTQAPVA